MSLTASARFTDRDVDVSVEVADGETIAIIGPNGAGKSSLLGAVAGTLHPDDGAARLDDDILYDSATWVPSHRRRTSLLAQEPLLFPHLSVLENVAFGPRSTGSSRRTAHETAHRWLTEVGAAELADRRPANLSGGQAQRVAVARALAAQPRLLMLDEPMAALDVTVVPAMRQMLRRVLADRTAIIVTHDALDALMLADRVVVIEGGRVAEVGPTQDIFTHPRSSFGAELAGLNLVRGTLRGSAVVSNGLVVEGTLRGEMAEGAEAVAVFTPTAVAVHLDRPGGSPRNVIERRIEAIEPLGAQMRIRSGGLSADVTAAAVAELDLAPDRDIVLVVKASEVSIHPA